VTRRTDKKNNGGDDVDALAELDPFSRALASAAVREEPMAPGARAELVEAAYIIRAAWLALHRDGDDGVLHEMAKRARLYLDGTETRGIETVVCKMFPLPSIKGGNRAERVRELLADAQRAIEDTRSAHGSAMPVIVERMHQAIERTFPELLPSWKADERGRLAEAIRGSYSTARELVTRTFRALGLSDVEIKNLLKSAEQRP
jgi:hypothetical protein